MKMSADELEYLISQYTDGTLNPLEQAAVEDRLASDASARQLLAEYQKLNNVVKNAMPMPQIAWDELARSIREKAALLDPPVRHYRLTFATVSKFASIAAMIAIAVGLAVEFRHRGGLMDSSGRAVASVNPRPIEVQIDGVTAPSLAASNAVAVNSKPAKAAEVTIGAAPDYAAADFNSAEAIISHPTSIWIASGSPAGQDSDAGPY